MPMQGDIGCALHRLWITLGQSHLDMQRQLAVLILPKHIVDALHTVTSWPAG